MAVANVMSIDWIVQMPRASRLPCQMSQTGRAGAAARANTSTQRGCLRYPAQEVSASCAMPALRQVNILRHHQHCIPEKTRISHSQLISQHVLRAVSAAF